VIKPLDTTEKIKEKNFIHGLIISNSIKWLTTNFYKKNLRLKDPHASNNSTESDTTVA
jgi:hypothetical protein